MGWESCREPPGAHSFSQGGGGVGTWGGAREEEVRAQLCFQHNCLLPEQREDGMSLSPEASEGQACRR